MVGGQSGLRPRGGGADGGDGTLAGAQHGRGFRARAKVMPVVAGAPPKGDTRSVGGRTEDEPPERDQSFCAPDDRSGRRAARRRGRSLESARQAGDEPGGRASRPLRKVQSPDGGSSAE